MKILAKVMVAIAITALAFTLLIGCGKDIVFDTPLTVKGGAVIEGGLSADGPVDINLGNTLVEDGSTTGGSKCCVDLSEVLVRCPCWKATALDCYVCHPDCCDE